MAEGAWSTVHDLPDQSDAAARGSRHLHLGNELFTDRPHPARRPSRPRPSRPTNAWGYVVAGRLEYNNAIGAVNLVPRFSFAQDVDGISPGPGGNFIEGRKGLTVGLGFNYLFNWELDLSYTSFFGADRYNLLNDRDFLAANVKFTF